MLTDHVIFQLQNQSELRASSAERAAFYLDWALAARSTSRPENIEEQHCNSHMLFTLHLTQYRMEKSAKGGSTASYTICAICLMRDTHTRHPHAS